MFGEALRYASPQKPGTAARWDGNIVEAAFTDPDGAHTYAYTYDGIGRLTDAKHYAGASNTATNARTERNLSYDRNGNITALTRYDEAGTGTPLSFAFTGNRIAADTYDAMGNLTRNSRKGLEFSYNLANLPESVEGADGASLTYSYLRDGSKWCASVNEGPSILYRGSFVYEDDGSSTRISSIAWDEGRISYDSGSNICDEWHVKDHLGSVRAIAGLGSQITGIRELNSYLPFGTRIPGSIQAADNRHCFSGKEEQRYGSFSLDLSDFGARYYDPFTCRWTTRDPLAGKYYDITPFGYCHNNSLNVIDPDGNADYFDVNGQLIFSDLVDDGRILVTSQDVVDAALEEVEDGLLGQASFDILSAGSMTFSSAVREGIMPENAALRVYEHYNYTGLPIFIDDSIGQDMQFTAPGAQAQIKINNENNLHGEHFFDNSYNIINSFAHEYKHWLDYKKHGRSVFAESNKPVIELRAIKYQKDHSSWAKTTDGYKKGIEKYETKQLEKWKRKR